MHEGNLNACWEWKGKLNKKDGRPYFTMDGKRRPSYSVALEAVKGPPPLDGLIARHSCDNRTCCNPHHLDWGTKQDNSDDMVERERHGVSQTVVRSIRKLLDQGRSQQAIAELYGISREAVSAISTGRTRSSRLG
tara:strand:- start:99 stop:503 length:405 start_codon:yes stop_codon:yes gene_type:complete